MKLHHGMAWGSVIAASLLWLAADAGAAATSSDLLRCQKKIETQARAFAKVAAKKIHACTEKIDACNLANEIDAAELASCVSAAAPTCTAANTDINADRTRRKTRIDAVCGVILPLADVEPFVGSLGFLNVATSCMAANTTALTDCLLDGTRCSVEHEVFRRDPRAADALTQAGVAGSFMCVGP